MATKLNDVQIAQREFDESAQAKRVTLVGSNGLVVNVGDVSFLYDGVSSFSAFETAVPANNLGIPFVMLAGQGQAPVAVGAGTTSAQTLRVVLTTDQTAIPISSISGAISLPTGAATAVAQADGNAFLSTIATGTQRLSPNARIRNDYTVTSVTTGAWVELIASLVSSVKEIEIFDSSGRTLELGTGAASSEIGFIYVFPGGNGRVPVSLFSGTRLSIRAVSANATAGEISINLYG